MNHKQSSTSVLLGVRTPVLLIASLLCFVIAPAASASTSTQLFSDDFTGTALDTSQWSIFVDSNGEYHWPYVADGILYSQGYHTRIDSIPTFAAMGQSVTASARIRLAGAIQKFGFAPNPNERAGPITGYYFDTMELADEGGEGREDYVRALAWFQPAVGSFDVLLDVEIPVTWYEFHEFAVERTPSQVIYSIDGQEVARIADAFAGALPVGVWNDRWGLMQTDWVEVSQIITPPAVVTAHWEFEGNGNDSSGNHYDGTVYGAQYVSGKIGQALSFDGIDDYVLGWASPFDFEDTTFTVSAWFKTIDSSGVMVSEGGYPGGWFLGLGDGGRVKVMLKATDQPVVGYDAYTAETANAYNDDQWHHVYAVITTSTTAVSGNHADIYIDGGLVSTTEVESHCYGSSTDSWRIGCRSIFPTYFMGLLDDVQINGEPITPPPAEDLYTLTISSTKGGRVINPGVGAFQYSEGECVYLEVEADVGYEFTGWTGSIYDTSNPTYLGMNADHFATANFRLLDDVVTIKASGATPDESSEGSSSASKLLALQKALESGYPDGLLLSEAKGVGDATYLFPIFKSPGGLVNVTKIIVDIQGSISTAGPEVRIGGAGPYRPTNGSLRKAFTGDQIGTILQNDSEGPLYWLAVEIDARWGRWDVSAVYVSYASSGVPTSLLKRFHDHFSIYQALTCYAGDQSIRKLYSLSANEDRVWEGIAQTLAFAQDLARFDGHPSFGNATKAFKRFMGFYDLLMASADLALFAIAYYPSTYSMPPDILDCLDQAVLSGESYVKALADAIVDGRVSQAEAEDLNAKMAVWKGDLVSLNTVMTSVFNACGSWVYPETVATDEGVAAEAELIITSMTPWITGQVDENNVWRKVSPTYLDEAVAGLDDFPQEQITVQP